MEKSKGLCRQITIPSRQDNIILQRLSDALYSEIHGKAPSKRAFFEPEDHRFSNNKKENNGAPSYGSFRSWINFQRALLNFTKTRKYVIVTDVANYYDSISYTHLRNILSSQIDVREVVLDTLIYILSSLLWQPDYMPRIETGLPQINIDAPRILAHCFLYELDEYLEKRKCDFVRYMDDIDIGVDSFVEARRILRDIDLILQTRQVRLNSGKTKILTSEEALNHFRARENYFLDLAFSRIERKSTLGLPTSREKKIFEKTFPKLYASGEFDAGAGEKILKRTLTLARKIGANINPRTLEDIFYSRPSCRENVLSYETQRVAHTKRFERMCSYAADSRIVDEISILSSIESLVDARSSRSNLTDTSIAKLNKHFISQKSAVGVYGLLWFGSKYNNARLIVEHLRLTFDVWRADAMLGRLVGGLTPVIKIGGLEDDLQKLLDNARNSDAYDVWSFHQDLMSNLRAYSAVKNIISVPNPTKPLGITHPKLLMLLSIFQNQTCPDSEKLKLITVHSRARIDPYYRHRMALSLPKPLREQVFL